MKFRLLIISIFVMFYHYSNAQNADAVSLEITIEEKLLEATIICLDAIEVPTENNEFAKQFITNPSFPQKQNNSELEFKILITNWLKENPLYLDEIIIARKKAHDKIYGLRPY